MDPNNFFMSRHELTFLHPTSLISAKEARSFLGSSHYFKWNAKVFLAMSLVPRSAPRVAQHVADIVMRQRIKPSAL